MPELILHHYRQSPVAEKVRKVLGIKQCRWRSVDIPRVPPKPDLTCLTGGYRRTPVLQIGADIYCDSQCIIHELDARVPSPSLFPAGAPGLGWALTRWTDGELFVRAVALVLGAAADELPADFAADRGRLYFGPDFELDRLTREVNHTLGQLRGQFGWIDAALHAAPYLDGAHPGLVDAACHHVVWFLRGRYEGADALFAPFAALRRWARAMDAVGHGEAEAMEPGAAIAIARGAATTAPESVDAGDPLGLAAGVPVTVTPDGDGGDPSVAGALHILDADRIAIARHDPRAGDVVVHFPRVGYRVAAAGTAG